MIPAAALIARFRQAEAEKWGYIWGTRGQLWTQQSQNAATRDMTVRYGQRWVGKHVADCSGLFVWAFEQLGAAVSHGSNTIFRAHCRQTGPLAGNVRLLPGMAVFQNEGGRRTHIGLYVGDGVCIEARGTQSGVIVSPVNVWDEWGLLTQVDYAGMTAECCDITTPQTTGSGDQGELVRYIQRMLNEAGYALQADGVFGEKTEAAVRAVQTAHGLKADGIVGPLTWPVIRALQEPDESHPPDAWDQLSLEARVDWLHDALLPLLEGRESVA